ncbi:MAG: hypothetical protein CMI54_02675 [Parcubacteria group bacterium]|jgi:hypothetical protein|nr:hypothetical protein [Parcubacteria group bacterium]|tara:strand:+ start:1792 stop:2031 length:240 start_codon:yes stop_codon:yes gene_type:complete
MKVKLLRDINGSEGSFSKGQSIDVSESLAKGLVEVNAAISLEGSPVVEAVEPQGQLEIAEEPEVEKAESKKPSKKKGRK